MNNETKQGLGFPYKVRNKKGLSKVLQVLNFVKSKEDTKDDESQATIAEDDSSKVPPPPTDPSR